MFLFWKARATIQFTPLEYFFIFYRKWDILTLLRPVWVSKEISIALKARVAITFLLKEKSTKRSFMTFDQRREILLTNNKGHIFLKIQL